MKQFTTTKTKRSFTSLQLIANDYGIHVETLKDLIRIHEDLKKSIGVYLKYNKRLLPPIVVAKIYETLGEP